MLRTTLLMSLVALTACVDFGRAEVGACQELIVEAQSADRGELPVIADDLVAEECETDVLLGDLTEEYKAATSVGDAQRLAMTIEILDGAMVEADTDQILANLPENEPPADAIRDTW